jgi:hypothetical protein
MANGRAFSSEVDTGSREENALFSKERTRLSDPVGSENATAKSPG